jgi:hypothetical protein
MNQEVEKFSKQGKNDAKQKFWRYRAEILGPLGPVQFLDGLHSLI